MTLANSSSVQSIKRYLKHAESCGVDCVPLLNSAGIDLTDLNDNTHRVDNDSLLVFLRAAIIASGDPCFGLNASHLIQTDTFDILGYIALNCSTLREAMEQVIRYESVSGSNGVTELLPIDQQVLIRWRSSVEDELIQRHAEENVIASWFRYARQIVNVDDHPIAIWFSHAAPDLNDLAIYQNTFNCEVKFDQAYSGILINAQQLDTPFPQANRDMLKVFQQQAQQQLEQQKSATPSHNVSSKVTSLIRLMMNDGIPSKELIAEQLGVSGRTLQRQLEQEGAVYKDLLKNTRQEMAEYYLQKTSLTIEAISKKIGFADVRSFQRSFKQWTGSTPGNYR
ncbi:MAG: AraC family transcriptional regulator [Cellvibrionaceae bacterium]|nr:AraC family transcriptional regulator [Cellvibrionaceae bacterium]|tara:strand:+ start:36074 stop:37087 length:1014 start_codon:yes stop_codon:yes gene_type:complete